MQKIPDNQVKQGWQGTVFPFLKWWPMVTATTLRADLLAGLTGAIVALPQGVAFATIAGMPPEYGLYAGMVPAIVAALLAHLRGVPDRARSFLRETVEQNGSEYPPQQVCCEILNHQKII